MSVTELLLIDLPYIGHSLFHANGGESEPAHVAKQMVVKVHQLAVNHPHAAVCIDSGPSFRKTLDPTYKAQRDTTDRAAVYHQIDLACQQLKRDGFIVWAVEGFEADDLIATATAKALAIDDTRVLIASSDKDLLQLVSDRVTVQGLRDEKGMLTTNGTQMTPEAVFAKLKVRPDQVRDYLALMGDTSDNIKGADGIGAKGAAELLAAHGTLDALYAKMAQGVVPGVTPTKRTSLMEFRDRERFIDEATGSKPVGLEHVRTLLTLRTDVPIPFEEIAAERTTPKVPEMTGFVEADALTIDKRLGMEPLGMDKLSDGFGQQGSLTGAPPSPQAVARAMNAPIVPYLEPSLPVRRASVAIEPVIDVKQALDRMARLQDFCAHYLEESSDGGTDGGDYGIIPGAGKKKVLLKSGADKLCDVYALVDTYLILTQINDFDRGLFEYTVECRLSSRVDDSLVGSGLGSCSSFESKYRYRAAGRKCPKCEKSDTIIKCKQEYGGGWICFAKKNGCGAKFRDGDKAIEGQSFERVENPDIIDTRNTVLKMAKKRAKIDAVIGVTRSSGIFTQDLED